MDERRTRQRRKALKHAKIIFDKGCVIDCTLRDLSTTGACVEVATPIGIPKDFKLQVGPEVHRCRVEWTTAKRMGLAFL
ncbi:MAG TPA: PilZ domain-containing protein [Methylocystis sp.]|nr:PilZ domain-containing protein [Methylocystis sp.]